MLPSICLRAERFCTRPTTRTLHRHPSAIVRVLLGPPPRESVRTCVRGHSSPTSGRPVPPPAVRARVPGGSRTYHSFDPTVDPGLSFFFLVSQNTVSATEHIRSATFQSATHYVTFRGKIAYFSNPISSIQRIMSSDKQKIDLKGVIVYNSRPASLNPVDSSLSSEE